MTRTFSPSRLLPALLAASLLSGCATTGERHTLPTVAPEAAGRGHFAHADATTPAAPPLAQWWLALGDDTLNRLETEALAGSPDLAAARARIAQARANLGAAKAALKPSLSVGAMVGEVNAPGALTGGSGRLSEQLYADNFSASWELDLFGENHRKAEAAGQRAEAAAMSAADAEVALTAQVASMYVELRQRQADAALIQQQVDIDRQLLDHAQRRVAQGTVSAQAVDNARSTLAQDESSLAGTRAAIAVAADQLAVLTGREPGALDALAASAAPIPQVPGEVAVGDPARLLRQRPDIRAAEAQWAASNADLSARIADRFPKISFTGLLGLGGFRPGDAVDPGSLIGLVLPQIKWTLFDGGRAAAQIRVGRGALDEADANYRGKVLAALEDAESSLTRFGSQRIALGRAAVAADAANHAAALQDSRASAGTISAADALGARAQALRAGVNTNAAQAQLTNGFIAVEKALGLGWQAPKADGGQ